MRLAGFIVIILLLAACDEDRIYERNKQFENRIWYVDSIPVFEFNIPSDTQQYDIYLNIRNTLSYPFQNIYIMYYLKDTTGQMLQSKLMNFQLFDPKSGEPFGESGLGDIYDHRFPIIEDYQFPESGTYRLSLQQYMRRDSLSDVIAVGVRVEENKNAD